MRKIADKCKQCPECGDKNFINKDLVGYGYRACKSCNQEWWVDIDYKESLKDKEGYSPFDWVCKKCDNGY